MSDDILVEIKTLPRENSRRLKAPLAIISNMCCRSRRGFKRINNKPEAKDFRSAHRTTLSNLKGFLGELAIPASGLVYVYLDVEPHVRLTPAYGSGWANAIRTGTDSSRAESFRPALYCQYVQDSSTGLWGPNSLVAQALNDACRLAWLCCRMLWSLARTARGRSSLLCSDGRTRLESILAVFPKSLRHRNIRARPSLSVY